MFSLRVQHYRYDRCLVAGIILAVVLFAFICPMMMLPGLCASSQQICQAPVCLFMMLACASPVLVVFAWLFWSVKAALPQEYALRLFRPPRRFRPSCF